uniref:Peroxin-3 n=1 Tax=Kalanchoe fedtschenkoi TaxID=63787 RepID=A0A7N0ULJ9_KALFE
MFSLRDLWKRHRRKVFVSFGVVGSSYLLYKLYGAHKYRIKELERELASDRENDVLIKAQLQEHFASIQRIADTTTLPHAVDSLHNRIAKELDLSPLTDRLVQGKGQPNSLTPLEKLELWERLQILSFTRTVVSVWALTMTSLYIRVQVNILGRHLYIDIARGLGSSLVHDDRDADGRQCQQQYLETSDFLSNSGLPSLIKDMQAAASEILKGKQLRDCFSNSLLHETILQILDMFMSSGKPHHWLNYLMPGSAGSNGSSLSLSYDHNIGPEISKFDQLMAETRAVLSSSEFENVIEMSLVTLVSALMEDMGFQPTEGSPSPSPGMPLAKLLPKIVLMGPLLLQEGTRDRYIEVVQKIPEVELFFTLLYANTPVV